jgi:molybdopterin molybdotransferase
MTAVVANDLIELEDARRRVLESVCPTAPEAVDLERALGRTLAEAALAAVAVQGFENSAMDGFAVRAADTAGAAPAAPVALALAGESRAGHPAEAELRPGTAFGISTGAAMPRGADAVVRLEDAETEGERVLIEAEADPGGNVRRAGEDVAAGASAVAAGTRLGPMELGMLAAVGRPVAFCHRRPRVAVLTSGDELRDIGEPLPPGGAYDSNSVTLRALVEKAGAEVVWRERVPDQPDATVAALAAALVADVVVVCGGISVGAHDHVRPSLAELGVVQDFWGVALKPGRPTWFGRKDGTLVFGLPGNPVSTAVTFALFVRPALEAMGGREPRRRRATATLAAPCEKRPGRAHAVHCRLEPSDGGWLAHPAPRQGSHVLSSVLGAGCLAILPAHSGFLAAGERVETEFLEDC